MAGVDVLVVGQVVRDLVLVVDGVPGPHGTVPVRERREMLGGKGANQAVGLAQLGMRVGLLGVVGDDDVGDALLRRAEADCVDVSHVIRRVGTRTGLIVDVLAPHGAWRYLEDLPPAVLLTEADVAAAAPALRAARAVLVQLQQPGAAALAAARTARDAGRLVVLDGAPPARHRDALLDAADVVRADDAEACALLGAVPDTAAAALRGARRLLRRGPRLVALAVPDVGNVVAWADGHVCVPLSAGTVVDTTGAGDAFVAGLTAGLLRGEHPERAAALATAAAAVTVGHPGGRPDLTVEAMRPYLHPDDVPAYLHPDDVTVR